ncbi:hypothetical protein V1Y59_08975 [Gordonia sp. PKS22-38]|uniref:Uncharacterized protein n=1 Tax=Gordonia prachuapensis TaxID=3115651 RepID=A0ABU7MSB7_9ACTN|nr:hypothetical protein [Gordonia sp. PKS22-38]
MMQVLFEAPNSGNPVLEGGGKVTESGPSADAEIDAAIDVFVAAAMVTRGSAVSARAEKTTAQDGFSSRNLRILRAG